MLFAGPGFDSAFATPVPAAMRAAAMAIRSIPVFIVILPVDSHRPVRGLPSTGPTAGPIVPSIPF